MYDLIVKYVETGDPTFLEKVAREALRSGAFLEHVLDLILITPVEKLPPSARRLAAGVKHLVSTADCSSLPQRLATPCEIAKRGLEWRGKRCRRSRRWAWIGSSTPSARRPAP
jgi:hypothetical protein